MNRTSVCPNLSGTLLEIIKKKVTGLKLVFAILWILLDLAFWASLSSIYQVIFITKSPSF